MSWAEGWPESFPQPRGICLSTAVPRATFPGVHQLQPGALLHVLWELLILWLMLTFLWVTYFCFYFSLCPPRSLRPVSFCLFPFPHLCLSYAGDCQNQRCLIGNLNREGKTPKGLPQWLQEALWSCFSWLGRGFCAHLQATYMLWSLWQRLLTSHRCCLYPLHPHHASPLPLQHLALVPGVSPAAERT